MDINTKVRMNNGVMIPVLALGTYQSEPGPAAEQAVLDALKAGYRHIDTAAYYQNEESVGAAIKKSGIPRKDVFITTKLRNEDHNDPRKALMKSLKELGTDYVDLYLIHWPVENVRVKTWKILEELYAEGKCKAIGVSNFTVEHLKELLSKSKIVPAVNQVEFHPWLFQDELLEFCKSKKILIEAYSPLTRGQKLDDPALLEIAREYDKDSAQILIRWGLQHGLIELPKSVNKDRIISNADVFDFVIKAGDMKRLDALNEDLHYCWDPYTMKLEAV